MSLSCVHPPCPCAHASSPFALPPLLVHVMHAAEIAGPYGYAEALKEFGELALVLVPASGLFDVARDDVRQCIESTAARHLASDATPEATSTPCHGPDDAATSVPDESISNTAYLLFGLALGLTFAGLTSASAPSR